MRLAPAREPVPALPACGAPSRAADNPARTPACGPPPRQIVQPVQRAHRQPRRPGLSRPPGHLAVAERGATRDAPHHARDGLLEGGGRPRRGGSLARPHRLALCAHATPIPRLGRAFYDPRADLLTPARGWTFDEEAVAAWSQSARLALGLDLVYERAFYPRSAFQPGESLDDPNALRLGPLAVYSPYQHQSGRVFDAPSFFVLVSYYLEHRYRTGDRVSAAIPYLAAGLSFTGDL